MLPDFCSSLFRDECFVCFRLTQKIHADVPVANLVDILPMNRLTGRLTLNHFLRKMGN